MNIDKVETKKYEIAGFAIVYIILFFNAIITHDSIIAIISAFCGISYTIMAGKGIPACYIIGVIGSVFYAYLSYKNALWGNLLLYAGYYVPMQIIGFFLWNKNLKRQKNEIVKTKLKNTERVFLYVIFTLCSVLVTFILIYINDKRPVFDSITAVFSILGMYLTVKRTIDQWIIWIIVNGLSFIMWFTIAIQGVKVYSTVIMWGVYFILAVYFYFSWKKELAQ